MNFYKEVVEKHGPGPSMPSRKDFMKYYGYRKGEFLGVFGSQVSAEQAGALTTEKDFDEAGYQQAVKAHRDHQTAITEEWMAKLREYHSEVSAAIFDACYGKAYEAGHSSGYYEVELKLHDEIDFAVKIIGMIREESKNA